MMRRLPLLLLVVVSVPSCRPAPRPGGEARAAFDCQPTGEVITVNLLPRPLGGIDHCIPDAVTPALLCTNQPALVRWRVTSSCEDQYTVRIEGDGTKSDITGPAPCHPQKDYVGTVNGDESLVCSLPTAGKYGYLIAVCRPNGKCKCTDPGVWVNRGAILPEFQRAESEAKVVVDCDAAALDTLRQSNPPARK